MKKLFFYLMIFSIQSGYAEMISESRCAELLSALKSVVNFRAEIAKYLKENEELCNNNPVQCLKLVQSEIENIKGEAGDLNSELTSKCADQYFWFDAVIENDLKLHQYTRDITYKTPKY